MSAFFNSKVLQGALFSLQKFVGCAFFTSKVCSVRFCHFKSLQSALFRLQNFCRLRFFRLQKFVECAFQTTKVCSVRFFHYKVCSVHFFHYKVCSVRFLRLQKFVEFDVSEQLTLAKQLFVIQSLYPPENQITLTSGKGQIVATAYGLGTEHLDV